MPLTLKDASGQDVQVPTPEEIAEMITGATRSQIEKANKKLGDELLKKLGDSLTETLKPIQEQIAKPPAAAGDDGKTSPELAAMKRQLEEQTKVIEIERNARLEAEKKQRQDSARASVFSSIDAAVKPELKEFLGDYLYNRVEFDEAGAPLIRVGGDDPLPLKDGIASFLKSKDAGAFLPAPTAKLGAGQKAPAAGQRQGGLPTYDKPANSDEEKVRRAMEREQALEAAAR